MVHVHIASTAFLLGRVYLFWMGVVSFAFFYNALVIPLRVSFDVYSGQALGAWLFFDYLFDIVYLLDIILVQLHVSFRVHGVLVVSQSMLLDYAITCRQTSFFLCSLISN